MDLNLIFKARKMNNKVIYALRAARKIYLRINKDKVHNATITDVIDKEAANTLITNKILSASPLMVGRLGAVELSCIANYRSIKRGSKEYLKYITYNSEAFWWDETTMFLMSNNAGFFPSTPEMLERFSEMMIEDMKMVDILGSWKWQEKLFRTELKNAAKIRLADLEPYNHDYPWSMALRGKKVLVVHPFSESILDQYKKKDLLFKNKHVLPDFQLSTIKAIQSIANNDTGFKNWFEALDHMKSQVSAADFDIAIIGCGAYGFPLAAHVKRMGKQAIHLGGATQTLFGITGKRWEKDVKHQRVAQMMNEHWVRPKISETPKGIQSVEGACYW
jgi:hypothetical protein